MRDRRDNWENKLLSWKEEIPVFPITVLIVALSTIFLARKWQGKGETLSWTEELFNSKVKNENSKSSSSSESLKNIWDERKRNGSTAKDEKNIQKTDANGKPFGSSYYYAHNSLRKTGGYTDGLRMEDYQMETPRLLSKNGVSYHDKNQKEQDESSKLKEEESSKKKVVVASPSTPIKKYLWDDPGDSKRMGTIRIDQLADDLTWKDADVSEVEVNIKDKICLTVLVHTKNDESGNKIFRLHIPQLYGEVREVKKVSKSNRLLIRLYKQSKGSQAAWPTPYKKAI